MGDSNRICGVAVVGCGTVGGGVCRLLTRDGELLRGRVGRAIELRHVVDIHFDRARAMGIDESLFRTDLADALRDPATTVVAELVGGTTFAKSVIEQAIRAGKHVVTANKALLAHHGPELYALAREHGVCLAFEASCAGGIPVVRALNEGLIANRIDAIFGIVNGTCNFILSEMAATGRAYDEVLAEAQADGLAEADPTLDVAGIDSAHKIAILGALAFGGRIDFEAIPVSGIDTLQQEDVAFGETLGYVIKLLAIAERQEDGVTLRVRPAFISADHPLAWVSGPFNAVSVYGHATGHTMYYGRGAGAMPTASAVVSDIAAVALGTAKAVFDNLGVWPDRSEPACQLSADAVCSRYYLRIDCQDQPGVLGKIAGILGARQISISSVLQHEATDEANATVPVVITTHEAIEGNLRSALSDVANLPEVAGKPVCIEVVEEYEEELG